MPAVSASRGLAVAAAIALVLVAAFASIPRTGTGDAQDAGEDRIAALETRIAGLERRVSELERAGSTPAPVPTEGAAVPGLVGTLGTPVPLGQEGEVGPGWTMRVVDVIVDGAEELITPNVFTDPPVEGYQFVIVTVVLTNHTGEPQRAFSVVGISTVGRLGLDYTAFDERCGAIRDEFPGMEVPPGGTAQGNLCFSVRTEDVESLLLYTDPHLIGTREGRVFFALT